MIGKSDRKGSYGKEEKRKHEIVFCGRRTTLPPKLLHPLKYTLWYLFPRSLVLFLPLVKISIEIARQIESNRIDIFSILLALLPSYYLLTYENVKRKHLIVLFSHRYSLTRLSIFFFLFK